MLVLRRRPLEVIVFEGGLSLTVLELANHKAWLGFEAPSIDGVIAVAALGVTPSKVNLGVRSPVAIERRDDAVHVSLDETAPPTGPKTMLVLYLEVGEIVSFKGMDVRISSIAEDRVGLEVHVPCLGRPVTIFVQSVSGIEARVGIDAPDDLRVMRKELWLDLVDANTTAAQWSSDEMNTLREATGRTDDTAAAHEGISPN